MTNWLRRLLTALLILAMTLPVTAFARDEEAFNLECKFKTQTETTVYRSEPGKKADQYIYKSEYSIPGGTYVDYTGNRDDDAGYREYRFYADGELKTGWLKADGLLPAWTVVYFQDGGSALVHESIGNDPQALADYCATYFPGRMYTCDANADALQFDATLAEEWTSAHYGEGTRALLVRLVALGLTETQVITSQGDELTVPTHYLKFADNVDAEHLLGIIYAPRTGEASLRETEGGSAKVIEQAKSGRIVAVLEYNGGNFTKILYDGVEGYIRTDCLLFHNGEDAPLGTGILHIDGNKDGSKSVTIRADASTSKAKIGAWKTGSDVIVHNREDSWYLVEQDGWAGFVQSQNVTLIQD